MDAGNCPEKIRGQIELAAEEIFVNIAMYAYQNRPDEKKFGVLVNYGLEKNPAGTVFTLSFADRGEPFNPLERTDPDLTLSLQDRDVGGLGVLLVKRTMDSIEYDYSEGMNHLVIKKSW
jgi:anti-sigma regulatory factor (Ser/Thr protein kinase)